MRFVILNYFSQLTILFALLDEYGKVVGLQETDDTLENVNLADADRKNERDKTIKRNRQPIYSALDDYEFQEGVEPGTKAPLLPQYEKEKKQGPKLELGEAGTIELPRYKQADKNRVISGEVHSLAVEKRDISDYYTKKEFSKFSKSRGDKKKKRKLRKRDDEDEDDNGDDEEGLNNTSASAPQESVNLDEVMVVEEDQVDQNTSADGSSSNNNDRGNRQQSAISRTLQEIAAEEAVRRQNFDAAVAKAASHGSQTNSNNLQDKQASQNQLPPQQRPVKPKKKPNAPRTDFKSIDFDEDDTDMVQALARARRIALSSRQKETSNDDDDDNKVTRVQVRTLLFTFIYQFAIL